MAFYKGELEAAMVEARRFLARAEALKKAAPCTAGGSRKRAAVRRASLDLTAALAQLRKRYGHRDEREKGGDLV